MHCKMVIMRVARLINFLDHTVYTLHFADNKWMFIEESIFTTTGSEATTTIQCDPENLVIWPHVLQ